MQLELSSSFINNIISTYPEKGKQWIERLPNHIAYLSEVWNFEFIHLMPDLSYGFVALVHLNEEHEFKRAIIKTTPSGSNLLLEAQWLKSFELGVPEIYQLDEDRHAILMEYLEPGIPLKKLVQENRDEEATRIICQIILQLQSGSHSQLNSNYHTYTHTHSEIKSDSTNIKESDKSPNHLKVNSPNTFSSFAGFKHILELSEALSFLTGHMENSIISKAKSLFQELSSDHQNDTLLHGDLHHDNILQCGSSPVSWKVIDPHGYIGDKAAEVGTMIRNPFDCFPKDKPLKKVLERRLKILAEMLPFDHKRMNAWCFCFTMLSAAWDVEGFQEVTTNTGEVALALNTFID